MHECMAFSSSVSLEDPLGPAHVATHGSFWLRNCPAQLPYDTQTRTLGDLERATSLGVNINYTRNVTF